MRASILMFLIAASLVIGFPLVAAGTASAATLCVGDDKLACAEVCVKDNLACITVCADPENPCISLSIRECIPTVVLGCVPQNNCLPTCMGGGGSVKPPKDLEILK